MDTQKPNSKFKFIKENLESPRRKSVAADYILDDGLRRAVEVAILLKQPLLLTGEPGTGKTRLAEKLAADLFQSYPTEYLSQPLIYHTKTVSSYTDLFYLYDALGHFHDAHIPNVSVNLETKNEGTIDKSSTLGSPKNHRNYTLHASRYIQLQAFGNALILSDEAVALEHLKDNVIQRHDGTYPYRMSKEILEDKTFELHGPGARGSVLLIDEVDKAPRDFTNDLLNELDRFEFSVKEDRNRQFRKGNKNIFLILTSNSEKNLPDAFLRRCIFYHIKFPNIDQLMDIVLNQLSEELKNDSAAGYERTKETVRAYVTLFSSTLRNENSDKKPATAELVNWIYYLRTFILSQTPVQEISKPELIASFSIIAKDKNDLSRLVKLASNFA